MRRVEKMAARVVEYGAPARYGSQNAEAEKTQRGFGEDGASQPDRCWDQNRQG
jgi:hypothetical protein